MPRRDDDEIQELEFDAEPAATPDDWEDVATAALVEDEPDDPAEPDEVRDGHPTEATAAQYEPLGADQRIEDEPADPDAPALPQQDEPAPKARPKNRKAKQAAEPAQDVALVDDEEADLPIHSSTRWARMSELYLEYKFWMNPRSMTGLDDEKIGALAASILRGTKTTEDEVFAGIEDPLEVVQIETATGVINLIVDGQRRYLATKFAKLGDDAMLPVVDLEPEPVKWTADLAAKYLARALDKVGTREGLSSYELSESAERLRISTDPDTGKDYTLVAVASTVGRSESWVSKILAARERATPALLLSWKKGEITDEQFKDLSAVHKRAQKKAATDVVEARKAGDLTGARTLVKEQKALAVAKDKAKETAAAPERKLKKGEQAEMGLPPPKKAPPFAVVEDMLATGAAHPPTHDYVKGMLDALKWDRGLMDAANFAKPWRTYTERIAESKAKPAKKSKK